MCFLGLPLLFSSPLTIYYYHLKMNKHEKQADKQINYVLLRQEKKISHGKTQEHDFFKTMISEVQTSGFTPPFSHSQDV